jgi:hypothetical protein
MRKQFVSQVGINDADYVVSRKINGKYVECKIYSIWRHMIKRCYNNSTARNLLAYKDCTVAPEWHRFSDFKAWHDVQEYTEGKQLDKDIIYPGNKVYSPNTCVYVSSELNKLFTKANSIRGEYPIGVSKKSDLKTTPYRSIIKKNGKLHVLGYYSTPEEAHQVYVQEKIKYIQDYYLLKETDQRIIDGLNRWIEVLRNGGYDSV